MRLEQRVHVTHGRFVLDAAVHAHPGEVLAVLGPNGAGKTTLLRALAGLAPHDARRLNDVGLVFQDYRLFPRMSARDNVAFPLRCKGTSRRDADRTAQEWLTRLGLGPLASVLPAELSGGQSQRVALARALAARPGLLLLDEPLAALDAEARVEVRSILRHELAEFAGVTVLVTHEPLEALSLADRVLVLENGQVVQDDRPSDVVRRPATPYVAALAGLNLLRGTADAGVLDLDGGGRLVLADPGVDGPVLAAVRPSAILLERQEPRGTSARNVYPATITRLERLGDRIRVSTAGPPDLLVDVTTAAVTDLRLVEGDRVWLSVKATDLEAYPEA